jgi:hypothetical protein
MRLILKHSAHQKSYKKQHEKFYSSDSKIHSKIHIEWKLDTEKESYASAFLRTFILVEKFPAGMDMGLNPYFLRSPFFLPSQYQFINVYIN